MNLSRLRIVAAVFASLLSPLGHAETTEHQVSMTAVQAEWLEIRVDGKILTVAAAYGMDVNRHRPMILLATIPDTAVVKQCDEVMAKLASQPNARLNFTYTDAGSLEETRNTTEVGSRTVTSCSFGDAPERPRRPQGSGS